MDNFIQMLAAVLGGGTLASMVTVFVKNRRGMSADLFNQLSTRLSAVELSETACRQLNLELTTKIGKLEADIARLQVLAKQAATSEPKRLDLYKMPIETWGEAIWRATQSSPDILCLNVVNAPFIPSDAVSPLVSLLKHSDASIIIENATDTLRECLVRMGLDRLDRTRFIF